MKQFSTFLFIVLFAASAFSQRNSQAVTAVDFIVRGGTVVTMNAGRQVIENGAVAVKDGKIAAVGKTDEIVRKFTAKQIINADGKAIIPGLINTHTHAPMSLFRGISDDLDLNEWLTKFIFPAEAKNVNEQFVRVGTRLALAEMIRGGTTTYCDMYYFEDAIADETAKAGVRGVLGETIIDFPVPDNKTHEEAMAYVERFVRKWQGNKLITPALAPHAPYTVSEEHLKAIRALSDKLNAPIVIHVAETQKEVEDIRKLKRARPIEYLSLIDFLNNRMIAAHVVWATDEEIGMLKRAGVGVAHNPQSNMKLASGVANVPTMLREDVAVGLGTDGAASNNDLNLWEEMDTAAKLHKLITNDPKVLPAVQAFEMATVRGARALHLEKEIGSLEIGKRADLVIVGLDNFNQIPMYNIYSHLVYATKANDVETVIIEGKPVMMNRKLLTLDEKVIKLESSAFRQKILDSLKTK
jgi:5-methylthioadenosine/S-adenosylhomocysteine deaminase